ncbi:zinc finger CCCH domain-containing protein 56-like [Bidens hawaiensis]|uniref:zinc finger CCCH domain-containing protein 56-like n=1 Tax=Bidens hawaiensis TaxID=980011 RepID=UPI004049732A
MPPLVVQTVSSGTVRPLSYKTKICRKWQLNGFCNYESKCYFAHGEAELRIEPIESEVNLNNQRAVVPSLPAAYKPLPASAVTAAAPANAGRSRQVANAVQGPIPSRNAWKVPKKINGIYGDWIDGHDID